MKTFEGFYKGVNLGGWISQFDEYDTNHFETFITEKDIEDIAGLGFDHVRVPVDYIVLEDEKGDPKEDGFRYLESCHAWCRKHGLRMIIDLHECFGYSFDPLKKDMDRKKFFYDEELQARFLRLWRRIAERFGPYPEEVAFEPLNEVVLYEVHEAWNKLITEYIRTVRKFAPGSYIIVGGVCYNSIATVPLLDPPADDKVVFNFHCYEPHIFTHQGAYWVENMPSDFRIGYPLPIEEYRAASEAHDLSQDLVAAAFADGLGETGPAFFEALFAPAIEVAEKYDVPLYCGEYGVIDLAADADKIRWLRDIHQVFKAHGIGHALWNYKEKDFGFVNEEFANVRREFMECL